MGRIKIRFEDGSHGEADLIAEAKSEIDSGIWRTYRVYKLVDGRFVVYSDDLREGSEIPELDYGFGTQLCQTPQELVKALVVTNPSDRVEVDAFVRFLLEQAVKVAPEIGPFIPQ